ncbi:hypothetical protein EMIT0P100_10021 [Pseudomonas sp. IT-P100]
MVITTVCKPDNSNLWRGSLLPLGCEAASKEGLLRSPAGASSLATGHCQLNLSGRREIVFTQALRSADRR